MTTFKLVFQIIKEQIRWEVGERSMCHSQAAKATHKLSTKKPSLIRIKLMGKQILRLCSFTKKERFPKIPARNPITQIWVMIINM